MRQDAQQRLYSVDPERLARVDAWLEPERAPEEQYLARDLPEGDPV